MEMCNNPKCQRVKEKTPKLKNLQGKNTEKKQVDNVAGAFLVLVIGMGLSIITALVEFFWVSRGALADQNVRNLDDMTQYKDQRPKCKKLA